MPPIDSAGDIFSIITHWKRQCSGYYNHRCISGHKEVYMKSTDN